MKKRIPKSVLLTIVLLLLLSFTAFADTGPKPSVVIELVGLGDEPCYGTLLSKYETNGPNGVWKEGEEMYAYHEDDPEIWRKFVDYKDTDGYCFLQQFWYCNEQGGFKWGYYPPDPFKVLLYFPESDTFAVSPIYEQYAFDSYYSIDISKDLQQPQSAPEGTTSVTSICLTAEPNYDYTWEIVSLFARIIITILLETAVALLFGLKRKAMFGFIIAVNIITQILLNLILFSVDINYGSMSFTFYYILLEILVFALEAFLYIFYIKKKSIEYSAKKSTVYALIANVVSFAAGLALAHLIPGIF